MGIRGERGRGDWTRGGCRMGRGSIIILFLTKVYPCSSRTLRLIRYWEGCIYKVIIETRAMSI